MAVGEHVCCCTFDAGMTCGENCGGIFLNPLFFMRHTKFLLPILLALSLTLPSLGSAMEGGTSAMDGGPRANVMKKDDHMKDDHVKKTLDPACVRPFVATREDAIITAEGALHTAWSAALQTRKKDLDAAWMLSDAERKPAVKKAWKSFGSARKAARGDYRTAVDAAWKNFKKSVKSCGATMDSTGGESVEMDKE